jgi:hypothetical protein
MFRSFRAHMLTMRFSFIPLALCGLFTLGHVASLWAQATAETDTLDVPAWISESTTPADLLPDSIALYAEVASFETLWSQPIRERLYDSELMQTMLKNPDLAKARDGIRLAEITLGKKLPILLQEISRGGAVAAVDRAKDTAALFIAGDSAEEQQEIARKLMDKAAQLQGREDGELPSNEYRGISAYRLPQGGFVLLDKWIVIVNKNEMGKAIIDRYLDGPKESLSQSKQFTQAKESHQKSNAHTTATSLAWVYADVNVLREAGIAEKVLQERPDDFGAELLVGGLFNILRNTPQATAELTATADKLSLAVTTPFDEEWVTEPEEFFFGENITGNALPPLQLPDTLATVTAYRNISSLWLYAGDLFGEKVNDQLVQAESTLTTLFSGKDFGEEILGAFRPEVRIVSTAARFEKDQPIPAVQVPAFALVAQMREPEKMRKELKRIFQSFIGFLNVAGAMNGQPQFDQDMDKIGNADLLIARYAWDDSQPESKEVPIQYNFTPCLLILDEYMVLSSTEKLARELIEPLQKEKASSKETLTVRPDSNIRNTYLELTGRGISEALEQNRDQIITNNMLEKGHSREEAEAEFNVLTQILKMATKLVIDFEVGKEANLKFDLHVGAN